MTGSQGSVRQMFVLCCVVLCCVLCVCACVCMWFCVRVCWWVGGWGHLDVPEVPDPLLVVAVEQDLGREGPGHLRPRRHAGRRDQDEHLRVGVLQKYRLREAGEQPLGRVAAVVADEEALPCKSCVSSQLQ